jgi:hypothetical protein
LSGEPEIQFDYKKSVGVAPVNGTPSSDGLWKAGAPKKARAPSGKHHHDCCDDSDDDDCRAILGVKTSIIANAIGSS